jgi:hypothetical protein
VAVEDQLVLSANEVADGEGGTRLAGALRDHPLAVRALAAVIRRCRRVDDQARARERLDRSRRARIPDVLADGQPDPRAADLDHRLLVARLEVAPLVEHAVVGQEDLAIDAADLAVREHRGRVVGGDLALGEADDRD